MQCFSYTVNLTTVGARGNPNRMETMLGEAGNQEVHIWSVSNLGNRRFGKTAADIAPKKCCGCPETTVHM